MKKRKNEYSPETWVTIRSLLESGQFSSIKHLYLHLKKILKREEIPSESYIRIRASKEGWQKHASDAEIAERKAQSIEEMFEEYGMPLKERVRRNVVGIVAVDTLSETINTAVKEFQTIISVTKEKVEACDSDDEFAEKLKESIDAYEKIVTEIPELSKGLKVALEYLKNSHSLCGDNAPQKQHHIGEVAQASKSRYTDMTEDELDKELARFEKLNRFKKEPE